MKGYTLIDGGTPPILLNPLRRDVDLNIKSAAFQILKR